MVLHGQDAWRQHPIFRNLWRSAFPGVRLGFAAFVAFTVVEAGAGLVMPDPPHHHAPVARFHHPDGPGSLPARVDLSAHSDEDGHH